MLDSILPLRKNLNLMRALLIFGLLLYGLGYDGTYAAAQEVIDAKTANATENESGPRNIMGVAKRDTDCACNDKNTERRKEIEEAVKKEVDSALGRNGLVRHDTLSYQFFMLGFMTVMMSVSGYFGYLIGRGETK